MNKTLMIPVVFLVLILPARGISEKNITTKVSEVTVFLKGAQVVRTKNIDLNEGETILKFMNLSPFIDAKSIQVKADANLSILSVSHQLNYLDKIKKSDELKGLENKLKVVEEKITLEQTHLAIIREEFNFLLENRDIGGKNEPLSVTTLQQASEFYGKELSRLKLAEIERNKTLKELKKEKEDLQNQINTLTGKKEFPASEVVVKVKAPKAGRYPMEMSYLVGNAGWIPSYDIRAVNINSPIQLIYKANVHQDTKVDWENVKMKFSSANPNVSGVAPELQPWYLDYNSIPPTYKAIPGQVRGTVRSSSGERLPGVNVMVEGTTIGTVTDMNGNFSISLPANVRQLTFSYVGYESQTVPVTGQIMNVTLKESMMALDEVVVTGGAPKAARALRGKAAGVKIRGASSMLPPVTQVTRQTTVEFEIQTPYTVKSDNKSYSLDMDVVELPAFYRYYSVPKIDPAAYLIANIVDWQQYNLLEAEANLFFEDTYIGKSVLDVRTASDTLKISLGQDKNVLVKREKVKELTGKKFIGTKKEETRAWRITVKNNKDQELRIVILDQVPVSVRDEIEVKVKELTGGQHDPETGEVRWEFPLKPGSEKILELSYSVKYPKNRNLIIE